MERIAFTLFGLLLGMLFGIMAGAAAGWHGIGLFGYAFGFGGWVGMGVGIVIDVARSGRRQRKEP